MSWYDSVHCEKCLVRYLPWCALLTDVPTTSDVLHQILERQVTNDLIKVGKDANLVIT